eukprot:scaffold141_cov232-Pinguiococcus_pyrenoidosus.AAC.7
MAFFERLARAVGQVSDWGRAPSSLCQPAFCGCPWGARALSAKMMDVSSRARLSIRCQSNDSSWVRTCRINFFSCTKYRSCKVSLVSEKKIAWVYAKSIDELSCGAATGDPRAFKRNGGKIFFGNPSPHRRRMALEWTWTSRRSRSS